MKVQENIPTVLQEALSELRDGLQQLLGDNLIEARLFGSRARGDHEPDSDVDVFVLVKEEAPEIDDKILEEAHEISLKYDLLIIPFVWTAIKLDWHKELNTLFYRSIMEDGIRL